jgi:hypothetical protein
MEHNQCRSLSYFFGKGRVFSPKIPLILSAILR